MKNYNDKKDIKTGEIIDRILKSFFSLKYPEIIYDKISLEEKREMGELIKEPTSSITKSLEDYLEEKDIVDLFSSIKSQNIFSYNNIKREEEQEKYENLLKEVEKKNPVVIDYDRYYFIDESFFDLFTEEIWDKSKGKEIVEKMEELSIITFYTMYVTMGGKNKKLRIYEFLFIFKLLKKLITEDDHFINHILYNNVVYDSEKFKGMINFKYMIVSFMKFLNVKYSMIFDNTKFLSELLNFIKKVSIEEIKKNKDYQKIITLLVNQLRIFIYSNRYLNPIEEKFYYYVDIDEVL